MKIGLRKWNFLVSRNFFIDLDFKNGCKNEFKDNDEKSCSWSRNSVSPKIDFKAVWARNSHAARELRVEDRWPFLAKSDRATHTHSRGDLNFTFPASYKWKNKASSPYNRGFEIHLIKSLIYDINLYINIFT